MWAVCCAGHRKNVGGKKFLPSPWFLQIARVVFYTNYWRLELVITLHVLFGFLLQGIAFFGTWYYLKIIRGEFSLFLFIILVVPSVFIVRYLYRKCLPIKCPAPNCDGMAYCEGSRPIVFRCHKCGHIVETQWNEGRIRTLRWHGKGATALFEVIQVKPSSKTDETVNHLHLYNASA